MTLFAVVCLSSYSEKIYKVPSSGVITMKVIYTAEPISGVWPEHSRMARGNLVALIEESLVPKGLVTSYGITNSHEFPFPFDPPNPMKMNGFFGSSPDYNEVAREITELFDQPRRERAEFTAKLRADLETATAEQVVEMLEKFHYTAEGTRARYDEAVAKVHELWKPYDEMRVDIEAPDFNRTRQDLVRALATIDNCQVQALVTQFRETQEQLKSGKRDEAVNQVLLNYSDWERKHLAPLYHACGDAKFYGQGFWMARLVVPEGEVARDLNGNRNEGSKTAEEMLKWKEKPFQVVQVPIDS